MKDYLILSRKKRIIKRYDKNTITVLYLLNYG